jgi:hypothetical protein
MPAGKRQQSNTMITLVVFVALFFVAAILAVVFYLNAENHRTKEADLQRQIDQFASRNEVSNVSTLVGAKESGQSWLGTLVELHRQMSLLLLGAPVESTSAEVRGSTAQTRVTEVLQLAGKYLAPEKIDPNTGMVPLAKKLVTTIETLKTGNESLTKRMDEVQKSCDQAIQASRDKEKDLIADKEKLHQQVVDVNAKYEELKQMMAQTSEERAKTLMDRLEQERTNAKQLNQDLLKNQAELDLTRQRLKLAMDKVYKIEAPPDRSAEIYKPDGRITVVEEQAGVVYINLGSKDRIYIGLTFAVYDGAGAIPKDGKGKAEVAVFRVLPDSCAARIVNTDPKHPIVTDDIVVNLIWDRTKVYKLLLVGDFDLNLDGKVDPDAVATLTRTLEKWGAQCTDEMSALVDAVVIGQPPQIPPKPTAEILTADPAAQQKFDAAQRRLERYRTVQEQAQVLMVPILPYDTFLYLIGYRGQVNKPGAF